MSNWPMAWSADPAPIQPGEGHGSQSPVWSGDGFTLIVEINPLTHLTHECQEILYRFGVDGHWFFTVLIDLIQQGHVDPTDPRWHCDGSIDRMTIHGVDYITHRLLEWAEADGQDDEMLNRLDAYAEEYVPTLWQNALPILDYVYGVFSNVEAPAHCSHRRLDQYLLGYSTHGSRAGFLHFDLRDLEFTTHENRNPL